MLGVPLLLVLTGSQYGADGLHLVRGLMLVAASAIVAVECFRGGLSAKPDAARSVVLITCFIVAVFGFLAGDQRRCVSGSGRECDESVPLNSASARDNTEAALIILVGLGGVAVVSALAGVAARRGHL
jgi:hypothetical protein